MDAAHLGRNLGRCRCRGHIIWNRTAGDGPRRRRGTATVGHGNGYRCRLTWPVRSCSLRATINRRIRLGCRNQCSGCIGAGDGVARHAASTLFRQTTSHSAGQGANDSRGAKRSVGTQLLSAAGDRIFCLWFSCRFYYGPHAGFFDR